MKTTIYLATPEGLVIISGSREDWQARRCLEGTQLQCVSIASVPAPAVYCGSFGQGIFISRDNGATWAQSSQFVTARVTAITTAENGTLYAGTEPSALYRSDDEGATWTELASMASLPSAPSWSFPPRPDTNHVQAILPSKGAPEQLWVAIEAGALISSRDGGSTWQDRVPKGPLDSHTLSTSSTDRQRIYSAAGDGFFESSDAGSTWQSFNQGLSQTYCWSVAAAPGPADVLLLSTSENAFKAHNQQTAQSFIYRRFGNGSWHRAMDGLSTLPRARIPVIAVGKLEPETFYLASDGVLYHSEDLGSTWQQLHLQWNGREPARRHSLSMAILQEDV